MATICKRSGFQSQRDKEADHFWLKVCLDIEFENNVLVGMWFHSLLIGNDDEFSLIFVKSPFVLSV